MKPSELKVRVKEVRAAFNDTASSAPSHADPSWYAHRGYLQAAGEAGAGHLAWERIAPALLQTRAVYSRLGRVFRDHELAYVMAYGLGLTDTGELSHADADALADAVMPSAPDAQPVYKVPRFWVMTGLSALSIGAVAGTIAIATPDYPTISAPITDDPESLDVTSDGANPQVPAAPAEQTQVRKAMRVILEPVQAVLEGKGEVAHAVTALSRAPEALRTQLAKKLLIALKGAQRVALVKALGDVSGSGISTLIRSSLTDADADVVVAAVSAAVSRGDSLARKELRTLLTHSEVAVRLRALEGLTVLGSVPDAHAILPLLEAEATHKAARSALKALLGVDRGRKVKGWRRYLYRLESRRRD